MFYITRPHKVCIKTNRLRELVKIGFQDKLSEQNHAFLSSQFSEFLPGLYFAFFSFKGEYSKSAFYYFSVP